MSKEEIWNTLWQHISLLMDDFATDLDERQFKSTCRRLTDFFHGQMQSYSRRQAIDFAKWMDNNAIRNGEDAWTMGAGRAQHRHTTDKLYHQFLNHQQEQTKQDNDKADL